MQPESTPPPSPSGAVPPPRPFPVDGAALVASLQSLGSHTYAVCQANGWDSLRADDFTGPDRNKIPSEIATLHNVLSRALEHYVVGDRTRFAADLGRMQVSLAEMAYALGINLGVETLRKLEDLSVRGR